MRRPRGFRQQGRVGGVPVAVALGDRDLVTELAGLVVEQVAPDELAVLQLVAQDYFADPQGTLASRDRDEPLGFGMDLALMTPYVLAVASPVAQFLGSLATDLVKDQVKDGAKPLLQDVVRRMFRRKPPQPAPILLTTDQVDRIHEQSYRSALALGLSDDKARLLADALAGSVNRSR